MAQRIFYKSPLGLIEISSDDNNIVALDFVQPRRGAACCAPTTPLLKKCVQQLDEYFAGKRRSFDLPLKLSGSAFQQKVWRALQKIPHGQTCSYADLAKKIGSPKACRAVGGANHKNKIAIVIPCHRVIGADGSLTGYAGGLEKKRWLLEHEKSF